MKQLALFTYLFITPFLCFSQVFDNIGEDVLGERPSFSKEYIRKHNIRSIMGDVAGKQVMQTIKDKGHKEYYMFLKTGQLKQHFKMYELAYGITDTIVFDYEYDGFGRLKAVRKNDVYGFFSHRYEFDSLGNVTRDTYYRDENLGSSKRYFKQGKRREIASESFTYEISDRELAKTYYNNNGKPYKKETSIFNKEGKLTAFITNYMVSTRISKEVFTYDSRGLLIKKESVNNWATQNEYIYTFQYDDNKNLLEANKYRNGEHITQTQFLYKDSGLFYARLEKDVETNFIRITKYKYRYY